MSNLIKNVPKEERPRERFIKYGKENLKTEELISIILNNGTKDASVLEISSNIFSCLRKVDTLDCNIAIIEGLEKKNFGLSIMNRLVRACENNVI